LPRKRGVLEQEPKIIEMPRQKMAVVRSMGDPNKVASGVLSSLYGSVYKLKFDLKKKGKVFKVQPLRARWPNAHLAPKDQWIGVWGLPIPQETASLPQKTTEIPIEIEDWNYGTVAQILHIGPFETEHVTVRRLHEFVAQSGYEIAGTHEEEYLTRPKAKVQKTLIRYPIRKK